MDDKLQLKLWALFEPHVKKAGWSMHELRELDAGVVEVAVSDKTVAPPAKREALAKVLQSVLPPEGQKLRVQVTRELRTFQLKSPAHYAQVLGKRVKVRVLTGAGEERIRGTLLTSDDEGFSIKPEESPAPRRFSYQQTKKARLARSEQIRPNAV